MSPRDSGEAQAISLDPRDPRGAFGRLLREISACKGARTCPQLQVRSFYFEPNPETIEAWQQDGCYQGALDRRVVFVCESPGPSGSGYTSIDVRRCFKESGRDKRFKRLRQDMGLDQCYITNTVKCGVRQGRVHTDKEFQACVGFLVRELDLLQPMVAVGIGGNAMWALRTWIIPRLQLAPPVLFQMTHYAARGDVWRAWKPGAAELQRLLDRLQPRASWRA